MAIRLPAGFVRSLLRIALKPFLRPPFGFGFQRFWSRLASNVNPTDRRASTAKVDIEGMSTLRAWPRGHDPGRTILYLHGGGYCFGSWATHQGLITHLAVTANAVVYAPNYRLAPEYPHPAALEDALAAYLWLLDEGVSPDSLSIVGDSAGGGLSLATIAWVRDQSLPLPASLVLISPWTNLRRDTPSMKKKASADPMLSPRGTEQCASAYLDGRDAGNPACSPLFANHDGLPPTLIHVGTEEILLDDSTPLAERCRKQGVDVTLKVFEGLWHEFQIHAGLMKESDEAVAEIAEFLGNHWH